MLQRVCRRTLKPAIPYGGSWWRLRTRPTPSRVRLCSPRFLPGSRAAAAHDNSLNCLQSDQQMPASGRCSRCSRRSRSSGPRPKHLPDPEHSCCTSANWVTQAVRMAPGGERQHKAVSHPHLDPPPAARRRSSATDGDETLQSDGTKTHHRTGKSGYIRSHRAKMRLRNTMFHNAE